MYQSRNKKEFRIYESNDFKKVSLTQSQKESKEIIFDTLNYFFVNKTDIDFRGFILNGVPSTGKTEIVKQVIKQFDEIKDYKVKLIFVDSSDIAASKWGQAERHLRELFEYSKVQEAKREKRNWIPWKYVILLDDIDCLFLSRDHRTSREWHFSINSVMFHELDNLDTSNTMFICTTNRSDIMDEALLSRLYEIEIKKQTNKEILEIAKKILKRSKLSMYKQKIIMEELQKSMENNKISIRDLQNLIITSCIQKKFWK